MLDMAILGLLEERDLHGYEIRRQLRDNLGILANVSFGSIYPALTRLEKAGAVVATEGPPARPPRRRRTRGPPDRLAQRRTGRPAGPPPRRRPLPPGQEGLPDHRQGPAALRPSSWPTAARSTTPAASASGSPSPGISPPRPGWPCWSAAGPSWSSASPRPRDHRRARRLRPLGRAAHRRQRGPGHHLARPADRQRARRPTPTAVPPRVRPDHADTTTIGSDRTHL